MSDADKQQQNQQNQTQPNQTQQNKAAAESLNNDPSTLNQLLQVILLREAKAARAEEARDAAQAQKNSKRAENARHSAEATLGTQLKCKHLKGGRRGPKSGVKDFAVNLHVFIDQTVTIKCHLCGMKWKKDDTVEYLMRNGKKIRNHTRLGWAEATAMLSQSTNTMSSSEVPMDATARASRAGESLFGDELVEYEF